jgi:long-chain acyl-CoA synthetase
MRQNLATLVDDYRRCGRQRAIVTHHGNRRRSATYAELADLATRFAAELGRREIKPGERVILWGENSAEWIAAYFGCVLRAVLVVPLDAAGGAEFARRVIAETSPRLLVGDRSLLARLPEELPRLALDELAALPVRVESSPPSESVSITPDTPLQILFTSGTTAEPKGVVHTHRNVLASLEPIEREMRKYLRYERFVHPLRFLHTLPLSHVFGQFMGLWIPPLMAAEVHFEARPQAARLIELARRERISLLATVPRVLDLLRLQLLTQFPSLPERLTRLQGCKVWRRWWTLRNVHRTLGFKFWAIVCGGAALPQEMESFWSELGLALIQGYGMTESTALITLNHPFHIGHGSIGKPLPGRELRLGEDGEILVRGEMVAAARWRNGAMQPTGEIWLATGDLAVRDAEGQLRFAGRKSEVIVTAAGVNIHPEDVEAALNRQAGVEASVVVPLTAPSGVEAVAVLLFRGGAAQAAAAVAAANESLDEPLRICRWMLWPEMDFPRTSTGKIQRHKVAGRVAEQENRGTAATSEIVADPLLALIASITHERLSPPVGAGRLDLDLHLDSLARVQLQAELEERLGLCLSDEEFERIRTLDELRARLKAASTVATAVASPQEEIVAPVAAAPDNHGASKPVPRSHASSPAGISALRRFVYPRWPWWSAVQGLRVAFLELVARPLVWWFAAPVVKCKGELPRDNAPMLLIANHVTSYDAAFILYALPGRMRRRVAIAMAGEMLDDMRHARRQGHWLLNLMAPFEYWLLTALFNVFPLPRSAGFRRSFVHAGEAMDRGYHVLVFPEGHRSETGALQPFRSGIGLLSQESGAPVLPVAVQGLGELKQRGRGWFRSGKIRIRVGTPVQIDPGLPPEAMAEVLRRAMEELLRQE